MKDINVPPVPDERTALLAYLANQRRFLKCAAFGLTPEQLRATPSVSALSVGGLLKHVAATESGWVDTILERPAAGSPEDYHANFTLTPEETLDGLIAEYDRVAASTERVIAGIADLGQSVPVPDAPWFPKDVTAWSVRWVLLHLIQETAHHAGHADIVRESIDGATTYALVAAAEDWPPMPWITPWRPKEPA